MPTPWKPAQGTSLPRTKLGTARANSLRAPSVLPLLFAASLCVGLGLAGRHIQEKPVSAPVVLAPVTQPTVVTEVGKAIVEAAPIIAITPENISREVELDTDQTFADLLGEAGAADEEAAAAEQALAKVFPLKQIKAGQEVRLSFTRTADDETLNDASFQPSDTQEITISRKADGTYEASLKAIPLVRARLAARLDIRSSLYDAGNRGGVPHAVMASLMRIYAHDVDFQRDLHPGDKLDILYDQPMTQNGKPVGDGAVIYAALTINDEVKPIYRVSFSDNTIDYFNDHGQSVRRALLRTPVAAAHVTSGFGMRMHPLLGYSKMHKGVDFGAPIGAPIFAAGSGTIEEIGFKNGYGRYIRIRHNGKLETAYAHMSRFGAKMFRGANVRQGEVIGYVGMSGRATGPHLHFETLVNNMQVNPLSVNLPTGRILEGKLLASFKEGQGRIRHEFVDLLRKQK